jgi:DNA-binding NtrC family response regulator
MPTTQALPKLLLVLPVGERRSTLLQHLESLQLTAQAVDSCRAVRKCMRANPDIAIVITQVSLTDGNWCDILSCVVNHGVEARVVVSSSVADERFWSEALWRGVHDVLVEPYDRLEVRRIVDSALRAAGHPQTQPQGASGPGQSSLLGGAAPAPPEPLPAGS